MKIIETPLLGAYVIDIEPINDVRGFFARTFCVKELETRGLNIQFPQCNISYNEKKATLRGMHYQKEPYGEVKIVRCTSGSVYDVIVDLRPLSSTYCKWFGLELSSLNRKAIYIPRGMAHGYVTLTDNTELLYMMSEFYNSDSAKGVRWNDPIFNIQWPLSPLLVSERDMNHADYRA
jgi:dTDP-4-dehydrorhamnose 3,5-epimerase